MQTQGGAAKRKNPPLHFQLGKPGIAGAQVDIGRQHQFDADGQAVALRRDNHRFADPGAGKHPPGITTAGRGLPAFSQCRADIGQVQPGGKVLAMGKDHRYPGLAARLEFAISQAQLVEQLEIKGVALGDPVQADQKQMTTLFTADATAAGLIHGHILGGGRGVSDRRYQPER